MTTATAKEIAVAPRHNVAIARAGYGHDDLPIGEPITGAPTMTWAEIVDVRWNVAADDAETIRVYYDDDGLLDGVLTLVFTDADAACEGDWDALAVARFDAPDDVMYEWAWR